jgi:hypothetical protein
MMDESLRKLEPIIVRFEKEGLAVMNISLNLSYSEKLDFIRRIHMAKEMILYYQIDLNSKTEFFKDLKSKKFISKKLKIMMKFLIGRAKNS